VDTDMNGLAGAATVRPAVSAAAAGVAALRTRVAAQHAAGAPGMATGGLATELFERVVLDIWSAALDDLGDETAAGVRRSVALVAVGGFGRREMAPYSDIDLMLLHDASAPVAVSRMASAILRDLYDCGLEVGQSVRTPSEAARLAREDATILSALFDMRLLAGRADLVAGLGVRLRSLMRRQQRATVERLAAAREEEADRFGHTVSLLQPNVKRSPGGLRDIQLVRWLGRVTHGAESPADLALLGGLSPRDAESLRDAAEFLTRVRIDLHLAAGKANDDLTRAEQLRIAQGRAVPSQDGLLGVERFMREYFGHTRRVAQVRDAMLRGLRGPGPLRRIASGVLGNVVDGLYRVGPFHVGAVSGAVSRIVSSTSAIIRLVELSMLHALPIDPVVWEAVREAVPDLPTEPDAPAVVAFLGLFERTDGLGDALRQLHDVGVLEILVPGFAHARHLLQFNNYHKYTVDEHCILAVERATTFARDDAWLGRTWRELTRRRPLLLALLFHDLGKGFPQDHSEVGAVIARDTAARLGLGADEAELIEGLVLKHLTMAHLAFRRDTGDESLVVRFACDVGSPETLRMLSLLTAADMEAVGPGTWTRWKADILGSLYERTLAYLDGEGPSRSAERTRGALAALLAERDSADPVFRLAKRLPASYLHETPAARIVEELGRLVRLPTEGVFTLTRWQAETGTVAVTVGAREDVVAGVFHRVAGALSGERLEILAAGIHTLEGGLVLDHFTVIDPDFAGEPTAERLADIAAAIRAAIKADRSPDFTRRWNPFAPQTAPAAIHPVRVTVDNESSRQATILEVFAHDSAGLLFRIAKAIFEAGLSVQAARIGTYLDQVVDVFHVTDANGGKLVDPARLAALRRAIEAVAAQPTRPA
jgi:[protein-PII] uridylyltransferase